MIKKYGWWQRPGWPVYVVLPLLHFASVRLSFLCGLTPEDAVVIWLPNAVLLAALLRFRGRGAIWMAALTFSSDMFSNLPTFGAVGASLLSFVNLGEVLLAYILMRRMRISPDLKRIQDLRTFLIAGPLFAALCASLLAAWVQQMLYDTSTAYLTLARVWWFGDALGLMIFTPLLLSFTRRGWARIRLNLLDAGVLLLGLALLGLIFTSRHGLVAGVSVTPSLLLPITLYIASRFGMRWTTLAVAVISLATAWLITISYQPFGNVPLYLAVVRAQEFILTLCMVGMGFSVLINELRTRERQLEARVSIRTRELSVLNQRLAALSATDGLTGIANRRSFDEAMGEEWKRANRSQHPLALMMLDVDLFKQYNDHYGHQAGDDCLRTIAGLLAAHAKRPSDLAARYGGEEFAMVLPNTDAATAEQMAIEICRALMALALPHQESPFQVVTISIGVAVCVPGRDADPESLIQLADEALYKAKQAGRNRVVLAGS